jgi:pentatricopeptide repeat protein
MGMLGRESGFKGKQRLDWAVAWAAERKALDVFHCSSYVAQLTRQRGRLRDAEEAFDGCRRLGDARRRHVQVVRCKSLISAYGEGRPWQKAEEAHEQMQETGLTPNDRTYSSLISAYDKGGQWQKAEGAYERMQAAAVKRATF